MKNTITSSTEQYMSGAFATSAQSGHAFECPQNADHGIAPFAQGRVVTGGAALVKAYRTRTSAWRPPVR